MLYMNNIVDPRRQGRVVTRDIVNAFILLESYQ